MNNDNQLPTKKLSMVRLLLTILILACVAGLSIISYQNWVSAKGIARAWFAPYVDVTATPQYQFQQLGSTKNKDVVLSFIVSSPTSSCTPSWGGAYTLSQARSYLDLDRRIARLEQQGGSVAISFGGLNNSELALKCTNQTSLLNAYSSVINRYKANTIDLDIEGNSLTNQSANIRRAQVISKLQSTRRKAGQKLAVWLTLPVTPQGLAEDGTNAVATMLSQKVDLAGVNIMIMDYGSAQNMTTASESAIFQTERQLGILYNQAHIHLSTKELWSKIGITPMIGQNDTPSEIFSLADAKNINQFAIKNGIGRMSMWSANRDLTCGSNYINLTIVSDACSGVNENKTNFTTVLSSGFVGKIELSAGLVTVSSKNQSTVQLPDNPATSPYQIWQPNGAYLAGTKVVWHHNVYQAKWWTQGDLPDSPVLQSWQTPWTLIGPVLPGEKPIPQPTLPSGTYPDWTGTATYNTGQRVLFNGTPYQAKWWNQGQSPAAAASDPNNSSWAPLTQSQVNQITASLKSN